MRNSYFNNPISKMKLSAYLKLINTNINTLCLEHLVEVALPLIEEKFNEHILKIATITNELQNTVINKENKDLIEEHLTQLKILLTDIDCNKFANLEKLNKQFSTFEDEFYKMIDTLLDNWYINKRPTKRENMQVRFVIISVCSKLRNNYNAILKACQTNFAEYLTQAIEFYGLYRKQYNESLSRDKLKQVQTITDLELTQVQNNLEQRKNLFDYKELNKLAEQYDYFYDRQKGSHAQFKHKDTGKLITIPQGRDIGKGLSIKIQKDIQTEKLNVF